MESFDSTLCISSSIYVFVNFIHHSYTVLTEENFIVSYHTHLFLSILCFDFFKKKQNYKIYFPVVTSVIEVFYTLTFTFKAAFLL